jgi:general secretion pathway protein H
VRQATRLGTHLSHARDEAVLSTREVELVADGAGWRVRARGLDGWTDLEGAFEPVAWAEGVRPRFDDAAARASFRFDPVGGASPAAVVMADDARALRVSVDAHGRVTIDDVVGTHAPR